MTGFTRRKMLTIAAATAATAAGSAALPEPAGADDTTDLGQFVKLSGALTGIDEARLAPPVDPIQVKNDYFNQAKLDPAFDSLMQIIRADPANPAAAANKVMNNADPQIKYLGRSIILAWYLGAWYEPKTLQQPPPPIPPVPAQKVISPAAYTQAWTWRVAQAHPMGYSELRFGYWSDEPPALNDFIKG